MAVCLHVDVFLCIVVDKMSACVEQYSTVLFNLQKGRTPLHLACVGENVEAAKCVAVYDPSSLHGIDKVMAEC